MLSIKTMYELVESIAANNRINDVNRMTDNFIATHPNANRKEILLTMSMVIAIYDKYNK